MNRCEEVLPLLLDAEPAELRGHGKSPLAEHLRGCAACARAASHLLEEMDALDEALSGPIPRARWRGSWHAQG